MEHLLRHGLQGPGTCICSAAGDQIDPRVSQTDPGQPDDHVLVVLEDHRAGNADIYGYDVTTSTPFTVCTNPAQQTAPRISGNWVVWQDQRSGDWAIWGSAIDPTTDTVGLAGPISPEPKAGFDQTEPDVSGDYVVWVDNRYGDQDIFAYDNAAGYSWDVYPDTQRADQDQPSVSGHTVVWRDAGNAATTGTDILGADLLTGVPFVVCEAAGDQLARHRPGPRGVDRRAQRGDSLDVRGYDLTLHQPFPVAVTAARQLQPTISDYQVVWTDNRNHAVNDLWAAAFTPWNASIKIDDGVAWTRSSTAELALFAQGKTGEVTSMTLTNKDGPAGLPEPYSTLKKPWYLTTGDGPKTVYVVFTDRSGASSPTMSDSITVDTHGPTIKVPAAATVKSGKVASIGFRVGDNLAPRAAVIFRLLDKQGNVVKVFMAGKVSTGAALHQWKFVCTLTPGTYKIRAWATDLAGNHQVKVGENTLTVS